MRGMAKGHPSLFLEEGFQGHSRARAARPGVMELW